MSEVRFPLDEYILSDEPDGGAPLCVTVESDRITVEAHKTEEGRVYYARANFPSGLTLRTKISEKAVDSLLAAGSDYEGDFERVIRGAGEVVASSEVIMEGLDRELEFGFGEDEDAFWDVQNNIGNRPYYPKE